MRLSDADDRIEGGALLNSPSAKPRARPALFRALGRKEPPRAITINGEEHELVEVFKHDSWAATALYRGQRGMIVAKFNREQPLFFVPMKWLGRWLARREARALCLLDGIAGCPRMRAQSGRSEDIRVRQSRIPISTAIRSTSTKNRRTIFSSPP